MPAATCPISPGCASRLVAAAAVRAAADVLTGLGHDVVPCDSLDGACAGADALIIANNHPAFGAINLESVVGCMEQGAFVYDYWNNLGQLPTEVLKDRYFTVGNIAGKY